jgi:plastocyanin
MTRFGYKAASATALIPIALFAAGCSSSKGSSGTGAAAAATSTAASIASSAPAAAGGAASTSAGTGSSSVGTAVTATEKEFSIALSATSFKAGTYTFTVHNTGQFPHNLTIEGTGVDKVASPTVPGGGTGTVTVALQKGSYELWCSVDSHKEKGMDMHITVA